MHRLAVVVAIADARLRNDIVECVRGAGCSTRATGRPDSLGRSADLDADVILTDANDPGDLALIESIRRRHPTLHIVAIGQAADARATVEARRRGADQFVRMPFDVIEIERALARCRTDGLRHADAVPFATADPATERVLARATRAAETNATVVIVGETGTGKTTLARHIHRHSERRLGPLVTAPCAALAGSEGERELFGGPGAPGHVASARGGTLVLEDVTDLAPPLQERLLHGLQPDIVSRPGATTPDLSDVRLIATARWELGEAASAGHIREELRLRLGVIELGLAPLRERPADVDRLAAALAERSARRQGSEPPHLEDAALDALRRLPLKGNAWELDALMQRAALLFAGAPVDVHVLLSSRAPEPALAGMPLTLNLKQLEREAIVLSLARTGGNRTHASRDLGISVRTLRNKIRQYGLA